MLGGYMAFDVCIVAVNNSLDCDQSFNVVFPLTGFNIQHYKLCYFLYPSKIPRICKLLLLRQAGRRLVRSLLTICDIGVSLHPWPMWITELRITRYSAAYAEFERRTKLVISKLQCNSTDWKRLRSICCLCWTETQSSTSAWTLSYSAVKLFLKNSNLCDHGTWSLRTDRRTNGRHAIS